MASVDVTTSPTLIVNANTNRLSIIIYNASTSAVYIGQTSSITTADSIAIQPGGSLCEDSGGERVYLGAYYGLSTIGTASMRYWQRDRY